MSSLTKDTTAAAVAVCLLRPGFVFRQATPIVSAIREEGLAATKAVPTAKRKDRTRTKEKATHVARTVYTASVPLGFEAYKSSQRTSESSRPSQKDEREDYKEATTFAGAGRPPLTHSQPERSCLGARLEEVNVRNSHRRAVTSVTATAVSNGKSKTKKYHKHIKKDARLST